MLMRSGLASLLLAAALLVAPAAAASAATGPTSTDVSFTSDGVVLHGTVLAPPPDGRRHPAMVLVDGSGPTTRDDARPAADVFVHEGIVTLIYDKRTNGYSTTQRSFPLLADDARAATDVLRARTDVDPAKIGMWGFSEGAWVATLAAARSGGIAFLVLVGFSGVAPAREDAWQLANGLRYDGISGTMPRDFPIAAIRLAEGVGLFPEADYDPTAALRQVHQPVLAMWGEQDKAVPPAESMAILRQTLDGAGNHAYTLRVVPGAEHALYTTADGGFDDTGTYAPGALESVGTWVDGLPNDATTVSVPPPPHQDTLSLPVTPQAWYQTAPAQLAALLLFVLVFAAYPVIAAVRLLAGRRGAPAVRWPARVLATAGLIVPFGLAAFVISVLVAQDPRPVVAGMALPFLVLRVLVVIVVVSAILTAIMWWRRRQDVAAPGRIRLGLLLAGGVVMVPWAAYWGLLSG